MASSSMSSMTQEGMPVEKLYTDKKQAVQSLGALTTLDAFQETCESGSEADTSEICAYDTKGLQGPPSSLEVACSESASDLELEWWLHLEPDSEGNFPKEADEDWLGEPLLPLPPAEGDAGQDAGHGASPCKNEALHSYRQARRQAAQERPVSRTCLPPLKGAQHKAALEFLQHVKAAGEAVGQAATSPANTEDGNGPVPGSAPPHTEPGPLLRDFAVNSDPDIEKTGRPAMAYEPRDSNRPLERWEREIASKATGLDDPLDIILEELQDTDHPPGPSELQGASLAQSQS
mmetsp:Transcript_32454/g.103015  ORF Transcript_32454/g.103015 Transcript_32454/m.103015 type:complete len:290 (+) Transcript_32454:114-983(+)